LILNYMVTSNHIHLFREGRDFASSTCLDDSGRDVIPKSIQLVAGRSGQEYNERKRRKGAFWEDRYHATAVENGGHLRQSLVYIDLNMVRAGVAEHPSEWPFSGYNEIQKPRRKCKLIAYDQLRDLLGFETHDHLRAAHRSWVHEALKDGNGVRDAKWSESLAACRACPVAPADGTGVGLIDRTGVKCPILFNWGGERRICWEDKRASRYTS
jgi:putative transposase